MFKKYKVVIRDLQQNISMRKISKIHTVSLYTILKVKKAMLAVG